MSRLGLEETLLGGQSFSWTATSESSWKGVIGKSVVELRFSNGRLTWRTGSKHPFTEKKLRNYLWMGPVLPPPSILCLGAVIRFWIDA